MALRFYDEVERMGIPLEGVLSEFSPGQMEINLAYGPALTAADEAIMVREMTREIAASRGYRASYLGRPHTTSVGSGLHVNLSLRPVHGGANAFDDPTKPEGISTLARQAIGGLMAHHEAVVGVLGAVAQQLQAAAARSDRRLLGQLGPGQPDQHVSRPGRAWPGHPHREPTAVRQRQPVPGRRGHAERGVARCRRRRRLRRSAVR